MQRQMVLAGLGLKRKMRILVTHMHGDHVLGLPGLIQTMALFGRTAPLEVYGPDGVFSYIKAMKETVKFELTFPIEVKEVQAGIAYEERDYHVRCVWTHHPVPNLAYALVENPRPGRFQPEKARNLGIPEGPLWGKLQHGETVILHGQPIPRGLVVSQPRPGRRIVYSGDTSPCEDVAELARDADLLIHEATFSDDLAEKASQMGHSTPSQAAELARKAGAFRLVLTHVSSRYDEDECFLKGASRVFPEVFLAEDLMVVDVSFRD